MAKTEGLPIIIGGFALILSSLRRPEPPRHSGRWIGAQVASLRCRTLRPGNSQYKTRGGQFTKNVCNNGLFQGINTLVLGSLRWPVLKRSRMAGFQVTTEVRKNIHNCKYYAIR
jgi:hypothetical protein